MNTNTIALSSIKRGDHFRIDSGRVHIMQWVDYPEFGSEAILYVTTPDRPGTVQKIYLLSVNDFAFYTA